MLPAPVVLTGRVLVTASTHGQVSGEGWVSSAGTIRLAASAADVRMSGTISVTGRGTVVPHDLPRRTAAKPHVVGRGASAPVRPPTALERQIEEEDDLIAWL